MDEDIDSFIVVNDLKQRGRKSTVSGKYIFVSMSEQYEYIVYPLNENKQLSVKDIEEFVDFSSRIKKKSVLAIVDKYGDVTYYLLSEVNLGKK